MTADIVNTPRPQALRLSRQDPDLSLSLPPDARVCAAQGPAHSHIARHSRVNLQNPAANNGASILQHCRSESEMLKEICMHR